MPSIPLGLQQFTDSHLLMPNIEMDNLFFEPIPMVTTGSPTTMYRRKRPGITNYSNSWNDSGTITGMVRSVGVFDSKLFVSVTQAGIPIQLWTIAEDQVTVNAVGAISSYNSSNTLPEVKLIYTQFGVVALNDGNEVWVYTGSGTQRITIPDGYTPTDICSVNNYLLIGCTTGRVYYLEPNSWTIDSLNYFTAESLPDGLIGIQQVRGNIYLFGQLSTEIWQMTGNVGSDGSTLPFSKAVGMDLQRGAISKYAIILLDNTVMWIGNDGIIYRADTTPQRISTFNIEQQIRDSSWHYFWNYYYRGHSFLVMRLDSKTLVFDVATQQWSTMSTYGSTNFELYGWQDVTNTYLFGSTTNVRTFSATSFEDYNGPITITISAILEAVTPIYFKNLMLTSSQSSSVTYGIAYRKAYQTNFTALDSFTTVNGDMTRRMTYMNGSATSPYIEFQITCSDNADINIISLDYNAPVMFRFN